MAIAELFIIAVIVVLVILAIKLIKNIVKAVMSIIVLLLVLSLIFGFFVARDISELKENLGNSSNIVLFVDEGVVGQAISFSKDGSFELQDDLQTIQVSYDESDYGSILDDNYKLVVFKDASLSGSDDIISQLTKSPLRYIIESYKDGDLFIYPETFVFKALRIVPNFIDRFVDKRVSDDG